MGPAFQKDLKNLSYLSISEYQGCGVFPDFWSVLSSIILENYFLGIYMLSLAKNLVPPKEWNRKTKMSPSFFFLNL